ncbi:MAG: glycosyltransferase family 87 protein [Terracidiphilus sp.]
MTTGADAPAAKAGRRIGDIAELSIALISGLTLALTALFVCVVPLTGKIAGSRDFVVYWATGQQLVHHANPYDRPVMGQMEHAAGLPAQAGAMFMRNPPWGLLLALPLGFVGLRFGALLWSLALLACLVASVRLLWIMHGRPNNRLHWLGLSFAPALVCVITGQTTLFALLGFVLFLRLHGTRPFLAGASLWLCALKPHLFLAFGAALLAWIFVSRSYKVLTGAAAAMAVSCAAVYCIDPSAWIDYSQMMRTSGIEKEFIPCLGVLLRLWISPQTMWLQYVPPALGCIWALSYFRLHGQKWDWLRHGSLVMLVSMVSAPYCWLFDEVLAIPALLQAAYKTRPRIILAILAFASVAIEVELVCNVNLPSIHYLWTAPAWLAWYIVACAMSGKSRDVSTCGSNDQLSTPAS